MDDWFDREIRHRLSRDPFPGGGFDERLKRRIEERIREEKRRGQVRTRPVWIWPAAMFASFAAVLIAVWLWGSFQNGGFGPNASAVPEEQLRNESAAVALSGAGAAPAKKYALLLGLRTERQTDAGYPVSGYRTLLVAADQHPERLRLMAELPGLFVPYGQHFWEIAAIDGPNETQYLQAVQATGAKAARKAAPAEKADGRLSEQVVYAGNAYLSVHTYYLDERGELSVIRRIKHIEQLNERASHPADDPHAFPDQFYPETREGDPEWIIYRNPGAWVSELYDPKSDTPYPLPFIPEDIVQHDRLNWSWEEILRTEPGARDAFTYGNLLGIITGGELKVYALRGRQTAADPVRVSLAPGEQVVMIQWAQNDKIDYVEKWSQTLRSLAESKSNGKNNS